MLQSAAAQQLQNTALCQRLKNDKNFTKQQGNISDDEQKRYLLYIKAAAVSLRQSCSNDDVTEMRKLTEPQIKSIYDKEFGECFLNKADYLPPCKKDIGSQACSEERSKLRDKCTSDANAIRSAVKSLGLIKPQIVANYNANVVTDFQNVSTTQENSDATIVLSCSDGALISEAKTASSPRYCLDVGHDGKIDMYIRVGKNKARKLMRSDISQYPQAVETARNYCKGFHKELGPYCDDLGNPRYFEPAEPADTSKGAGTK